MSSSVELNESPPAAPVPPVQEPAAKTGRPRFTVTTNDVPIPRRTGFALLRVSAGSFVTYGLLVAAMVWGKLYFLDHPTDFPLESQAQAFEWRMLVAIASCGLLGLMLAPYARFPDMWERSVPHWKRLLVPVFWGTLYGLVTITRDLPNPSEIHLYYPASIPFYGYGAIFLEILLRLFGVTLITWMLGEVLFMGYLRGVAFWIANFVASIYEPLPHVWEDLQQLERPEQVPATLVDWAFHPLFLSNVLTGYLYRRCGFLTAVLFRLSFYGVWHVGYGNFWKYDIWRWG